MMHRASRTSHASFAALSGTHATLSAFDRSADGKISFVFHEDRHISSHADDREAEIVALAVGHFQKMLSKMRDEFRKKNLPIRSYLGNCTVFYSEPFSVSGVVSDKAVYPRPVSIEERSVEAMSTAARDKFVEHVKSELGSAKAGKLEIREQTILRSKIDGYEVKKFFYRHAWELELSFEFGAMRGDIHNKTKDTLSAYVDPRYVSERTADESLFEEIRMLLPGTAQYIYALLLPERSIVTRVKDSIPTQTLGMSFGATHCTRSIADSLGVSMEVARSYIALHSEGKLHGSAEERLIAAGKETAGKWVDSFTHTLSVLEEEILVPRLLFVVPSDDASTFVAKFLTDKAQNPLHDRFAISEIGTGTLGDFSTLPDSRQTPTLTKLFAKHALRSIK